MSAPETLSNGQRTAENLSLEVGDISFAYRRFGNLQTALPVLVMLQHFRGNLDSWDPALVDRLAQDREVIILDNRGVGGSTGVVPENVTIMARDALAFIDALSFKEIDLLGFSLGGYVAQELVLLRPRLVRRLVLAGTAPQGGPDLHRWSEDVYALATPDQPTAEDLLSLFFSSSDQSQAKGMESLGRLYQREVDRDEPTDLATRDAQLAAITAWGIPDESKLNRLAGITQPTLVANGDHDPMMHTQNSYLLAERLPNAQLRIYPDSGHGFLNQYPELFADDVHAFLATEEAADPPHAKESQMSVITSRNPVVLEPASQELVEATVGPPFLHELGPAEARAVLDELQAAPIDKLPVKDLWTTVPADVGDVRVRIVRPPDAVGSLPVILYMHGGGWVLGSADTHDRLVRELAVGTGAAVVFVEYDRSPEARYPVAIEQGYATAQWIMREGSAHQLNPYRIAVAGDSVGGNMAAALTLMAQERRDVRFLHQSLYYPVTDAAMDTGSYEQFAEGYFLTAKTMAWFWDAYEPDAERRLERFASPLRASDEQLAGLPPAFLMVGEADVLRDEGEAYAARLRAAGTPVTTVRYDGITHDFMMLNALRDTHASRAAIAQAIAILRQAVNIK